MLLVASSAWLTPAIAHAQATPASHLAWDQAGPDLTTVQAYQYRHYDDGATAGVLFTGVTCTAGPATPAFPCTVLFPPFTPGPHTIVVTAANDAGESDKSAPFSFTMIVKPAAPVAVRLVR